MRSCHISSSVAKLSFSDQCSSPLKTKNNHVFTIQILISANLCSKFASCFTATDSTKQDAYLFFVVCFEVNFGNTGLSQSKFHSGQKIYFGICHVGYSRYAPLHRAGHPMISVVTLVLEKTVCSE
jgi:hypothetical protein